MATKLKESTVVRETGIMLGGRAIICAMTPFGIRLHLTGTQQAVHVDYLTLLLEGQAKARRGGESNISIPAGRRRK